MFKWLLIRLCLWVCHTTEVILQKRDLSGWRPLQLEKDGKWVKRQITAPLRTADARPQLWLTVIMLVRVHVYSSCCAVGEFYRNAEKSKFHSSRRWNSPAEISFFVYILDICHFHVLTYITADVSPKSSTTASRWNFFLFRRNGLA